MGENRINILIKNYDRLKIEEDTIFKSRDREFIVKFGSRCIDKNFNLSFISTKQKAKKIKINLNGSAPIRPYVNMLNNKNEATQKEVVDRIENKKFYLEEKE